MARHTPAELLEFIAAYEPLEATLTAHPGLSREVLRDLLRKAAEQARARAADVRALRGASVPPSTGTLPLAPRPPPAAPLQRAPEPLPAPGSPPPSPRSESTERRFLRVYSDGAARGNPGPAGAGAVVMKEDGTVVAKLGQYLGAQTNNHAEYSALILGLEAALKLGANEVEAVADSELMVRQLEGRYRVKSPTLFPLFERARALLRQFRSAKVRHVLREQNRAADEMSNRAIDERM